LGNLSIIKSRKGTVFSSRRQPFLLFSKDEEKFEKEGKNIVIPSNLKIICKKCAKESKERIWI